jgi:hypothetical protein
MRTLLLRLGVTTTRRWSAISKATRHRGSLPDRGLEAGKVVLVATDAACPRSAPGYRWSLRRSTTASP